jgi:parallel beta-helix repeat protein
MARPERNATRRRAQWLAVTASVAIATLAVATSWVADSSSTPAASSTMAAARASAPRAGAPGAPTRVSARPVSAGMRVAWRAPAKRGSRITGYVVTPHANGTTLRPRRFASAATAHVVTGLKVGRVYAFTVVARNSSGAGPRSRPSGRRKLSCVGVPLTAGQRTIDRAPAGTTFCLSGKHNWTLTPKSRDRLVGPAILDGGHARQYAINAGHAKGVVVSSLEIRNYVAANQQGAIFVPDYVRRIATGWSLFQLSVHDNGRNGAGAGTGLGRGWKVFGGRYYNNRQEGIGGAGGADVLDGVELDHNNFTNNTYKTANPNCGFEAGGFKWVADNMTVKNSKIHNNGCRGLWSDGSSNGILITNNRIYNNWAEGIFIEISSHATITHNIVTNNGWHTNGKGKGCSWLWGGGITLASSDRSTVANNVLSRNCNGITGTQQNRSGALLANLNIHNNVIGGPGGKTGAVEDNGANLRTRNIVFTNNRVQNRMTFCNLNC